VLLYEADAPPRAHTLSLSASKKEEEKKSFSPFKTLLPYYLTSPSPRRETAENNEFGLQGREKQWSPKKQNKKKKSLPFFYPTLLPYPRVRVRASSESVSAWEWLLLGEECVFWKWLGSSENRWKKARENNAWE
jgi:hypothetical protein